LNVDLIFKISLKDISFNIGR